MATKPGDWGEDLDTTWAHIFVNVFGYSMASNAYAHLHNWVHFQCFNKFSSFSRLHIGKLVTDRDNLNFKTSPSSKTINVLPNSLITDLQGLLVYIWKLKAKETQLGPLASLTEETFSEFMDGFDINEYSKETTLPAPSTGTPSLATSVDNMVTISSTQAEPTFFCKSFKQDVSAFNTISTDTMFDMYQLNVTAKAVDQCVSEVLDPSYTPGPSPAEQALFKAKNTYMYNVFDQTCFLIWASQLYGSMLTRRMLRKYGQITLSFKG